MFLIMNVPATFHPSVPSGDDARQIDTCLLRNLRNPLVGTVSILTSESSPAARALHGLEKGLLGEDSEAAAHCLRCTPLQDVEHFFYSTLGQTAREAKWLCLPPHFQHVSPHM